MTENKSNNYYSFYPLLSALLEQGVNLSVRGIFLYSLMQSRKELSLKNRHRFTDEKGVYIIFTNAEICKILKCSQPTATATVNELVKAGVLSRKTERGKSTKYYVTDLNTSKAQEQSSAPNIYKDVSFDVKKATERSKDNRTTFGSKKNPRYRKRMEKSQSY